MTHFKVGDVVEATVDAQGMTRGEQFSVKAVETYLSGPFGNFVRYTLSNTGQKLEVVNAHLCLRRVK